MKLKVQGQLLELNLTDHGAGCVLVSLTNTLVSRSKWDGEPEEVYASNLKIIT